MINNCNISTAWYVYKVLFTYLTRIGREGSLTPTGVSNPVMFPMRNWTCIDEIIRNARKKYITQPIFGK